jgi:hypothetical protein
MLHNEKKALSYEVSRCGLGICYVGAIVSLCFICVAFSLPMKLFGATDRTTAAWFFNIVLYLFAFTALSLPFDIVGFSIEHRFGKDSKTLLQYLGQLSKAVTKYSILMLTSIFVFTFAAKTQNLLAVTLACLALSIFASWKQAEAARFLSSLEFQEMGETRKAFINASKFSRTDIVVAVNQDQGFTGGIVGLPMNETVIIPSSRFRDLTAEELRTEVTRRALAITSGNRTIGLMGAVVFVVAGLTISAKLTGLIYALPLESTAGTVTTAMFSTIWTFLGLLVLPVISQRSVNQIDRMTIESGTDVHLLSQTISKLSDKTENASDRASSVQLIFHPIPTAEQRLQELNSGSGARLWNVSRYAVWLSCAGMGLLGRAVHCNAGKPELWCILPAD